jgi:hypothetical protein
VKTARCPMLHKGQKKKAFLAGPERRRERPFPSTTTQPKRPEM